MVEIVKDAFAGIVASYSELTGTSKVVLLFLVSVIAIILINENIKEDDERRRVNPVVFLLSIWSGIAYAGVKIADMVMSKITRVVTVIIFISTMIILSGKFVITKECYENSVLYGATTLMKAVGVLSILIYLGVYYMISRQLFKIGWERAVFLYFVIILHLFANYSAKAMGLSLFIAPITKTSIGVHAVMPLLLLLYLKFEKDIKARIESEGELENAQITDSEEIPEEWDMKKHKILNIRNMAIAFAALFILFMASIFVLNSKINSLYEATVVLENAANTKMTVDEHKDANGAVDVQIMVSPEGSVTVIGGGMQTSGTEVFDMINKYSDRVEKWYIYGEEDRGAYDFCIEQGMEVGQTLIVTGVEEE